MELAVWLNKQGHMPEQVQDFYPTPGTLATCMWYTELDPRTMKPVFVPKTPHDKAMQRALMQWRKPQNRGLVLEALRRTGRTDLIGYGKHCLIRPDKESGGQTAAHRGIKSEKGKPGEKKSGMRNAGVGSERGKKSEHAPKPVRKAGWAKPTPKKNARKKKG